MLKMDTKNKKQVNFQGPFAPVSNKNKTESDPEHDPVSFVACFALTLIERSSVPLPNEPSLTEYKLIHLSCLLKLMRFPKLENC